MVVVAVRVGDHRAAATPAIRAGKAVFVEWPLGRGLEETSALAALAREKGVRGMVGAQAMQSPALHKVLFLDCGQFAVCLLLCLLLFCVDGRGD